MVDKIRKTLRKMSKHDFASAQKTIALIVMWRLDGLDVKKLKGKQNEYRVRCGDYRIIFSRDAAGEVTIIDVDRRGESTYR